MNDGISGRPGVPPPAGRRRPAAWAGAIRTGAESIDSAPENDGRAMSPEPLPIQKRFDDFRQLNRVHAGSLIISVFGDAVLPRGGRIWLGSLIRLLEPLGLNERLVRTSVFRLAREGWLRSEPAGRRTDYLLTPSGQQRSEEASRHIYASSTPQWDRR